MKLLITGSARHGKDTVCEMLKEDYGLSFVSSSYFVAEKAVRPYLATRNIVYDTLDECYADRVNHRPLWHDAILDYNTPDRARMARELFAQYDMYCGLRNREEFLAIKAEKLFDVSIWVDRSKYVEPEKWASMQITSSDCDVYLGNNGTLQDLRKNVEAIYIKIVTGTVGEI